MTPRQRADDYWAAVFRIDPPELRAAGLHTTFVDDPSAGIYVLRLDETVRIRAPRLRREDVTEVCRDLALDDALDPSVWSAGLRTAAPVVLGPASHYLAATAVGASDPEDHPDPDDVRRMASRILPEEVEESGVLDPGSELFGIRSDGVLAAVSALSDWVGGRTDVGLLVAPAFRGRGLGRRVAAVALDAAIGSAGIARWRCREDNTASVRIATALGLQPYARNLGIRLDAQVHPA